MHFFFEIVYVRPTGLVQLPVVVPAEHFKIALQNQRRAKDGSAHYRSSLHYAKEVYAVLAVQHSCNTTLADRSIAPLTGARPSQTIHGHSLTLSRVCPIAGIGKLGRAACLRVSMLPPRAICTSHAKPRTRAFASFCVILQ